MARTTYVKSARKSKSARRCLVCGKEIKEGDSYKWFATRIGRSSQRKNYCGTCSIPRSHQTSSQQLSTLYDVLDNAEKALIGVEDVSDLESILTETAEGVREVAQMYEESADNMESGFGHSTYLSEEIRNKGSELESFADTLESAVGDLEEFEDGDARTEAEEIVLAEIGVDSYAELEANDYDLEDYERQVNEKVNEAQMDWREQQLAKVESALNECPF